MSAPSEWRLLQSKALLDPSPICTMLTTPPCLLSGWDVSRAEALVRAALTKHQLTYAALLNEVSIVFVWVPLSCSSHSALPCLCCATQVVPVTFPAPAEGVVFKLSSGTQQCRRYNTLGTNFSHASTAPAPPTNAEERIKKTKELLRAVIVAAASSTV